MPVGVYIHRRRAPYLRFKEKVKIADSGCWEWQGCLNQKGYGDFWGGERHGLAHRWSYEYHIGPIPQDLVIDHLCRNTSCVNPEHLECVPMKVNTDRGLLSQVQAAKAAIRTHCIRDHEYTPENTIFDKKGDRCCKKCQRMKAEEWRIKNRGRVNEMQQIRRAKAKQKINFYMNATGQGELFNV